MITQKTIILVNKRAFTLIELIVVITILAILGTIAFLGLQGYSKDARNSVRITDGKNLGASLELFSIKSGKYPYPSDYISVSSGSTIFWYSGTVGESVINKIENLSKLPLDPKTETMYEYSTSYGSIEYQLAIELEEGLAKGGTLYPVYAETTGRAPNITGSYNNMFLVASDKNYYAIPSLFSSGSTFNLDRREVNFTITNLGPKPTTGSGYINFITTLQNLYNTGATQSLLSYRILNELEESKFEEMGKILLNEERTSSVSSFK